jgi:hypothetical protein
MHHKSLESQVPYTGKGQQEISNELNKATLQMANPESKVKPRDWKTLVEHGFDDIYPKGISQARIPNYEVNNGNKRQKKDGRYLT